MTEAQPGQFKTYIESQIKKLEFRHGSSEYEITLAGHTTSTTDISNVLTVVYDLSSALSASSILKVIIQRAVNQEQISIVFTGERGERYLEVSSQIQPDIMSARYSSTSALDSTDIRSNFIFLNSLDRNQRYSYRLTPDSFKALPALTSGGTRFFYKKTEDNPLDLDSRLFNFNDPSQDLLIQYALVDVQFNARQLLKAHVYRYKCRFKWVDHIGIEHRSGWSDTLTLLTNRPMGEAGNQPTFNINNLHLSNKPRGSLSIEVYRTSNRLSTYRLIKEITNNRDTQFTVVTDDVLDEDLGQVGPPDNTLISGARNTVEYKGRYVLYGFPDKANRIVISSPLKNFTNEAVDFKTQGIAGDLIELLMDDPVVCVRSLDQFLNIHTTKKIYTWVINERASNQAYPTEVTALVNTRARDSVSAGRTSDGILFASDKGIWTLTRSLRAMFSGADVQDFNGRIKDISNLRKNEETRCLTDSREFPVLVYNDRFKQWSSLSVQGLISSTIWRDKWVVLNNRGELLEEETETTEPIYFSFTTGWVNFSVIQGFQRVRDFTLLATFQDLTLLQAEIFYDFDESIAEIVRLDLNALKARLPITTLEQSLDILKQFRFQQRRQKCTAIKMRFIMEARSAEVSAITFSVLGLKGQYLRSSQN